MFQGGFPAAERLNLPRKRVLPFPTSVNPSAKQRFARAPWGAGSPKSRKFCGGTSRKIS